MLFAFPLITLVAWVQKKFPPLLGRLFGTSFFRLAQENPGQITGRKSTLFSSHQSWAGNTWVFMKFSWPSSLLYLPTDQGLITSACAISSSHFGLSWKS